MRRALLPRHVAVLVALTAVAVTAGPASAAPRWQRLRFEFRVDGGIPFRAAPGGPLRYRATLELEIRVRATGRPGFLAQAIVVRDAAGAATGIDRVRVDEVNVAHDQLAIHGRAVGSHDLCQPPADCRVRRTADSYTERLLLDIETRTPMHYTQYFVAEGTQVSVKVIRRVGWRALLVRGGGFATLTRDQADSDGADIAGTRYEATRGATLPGGPRGSVALVAPPCPATGAGMLQLHGGPAPVTITCPTSGTGATAAAATRWTVNGAAVGATTGRIRLVVLDR